MSFLLKLQGNSESIINNTKSNLFSSYLSFNIEISESGYNFEQIDRIILLNAGLLSTIIKIELILLF